MNSSFQIDMMERCLELDSFINLALNECKKPLNVSTRDETEILKDILPILKVIRSVIKDISGSDYPTYSLIKPIINCMEKKLVVLVLKLKLTNNSRSL